jgi:hypothetical protein
MRASDAHRSCEMRRSLDAQGVDKRELPDDAMNQSTISSTPLGRHNHLRLCMVNRISRPAVMAALPALVSRGASTGGSTGSLSFTFDVPSRTIQFLRTVPQGVRSVTSVAGAVERFNSVRLIPLSCLVVSEELIDDPTTGVADRRGASSSSSRNFAVHVLPLLCAGCTRVSAPHRDPSACGHLAVVPEVGQDPCTQSTSLVS